MNKKIMELVDEYAYQLAVRDPESVAVQKARAAIEAALPNLPDASGNVPTVPERDAFTVNFMRLAGLDKHKARECAEIVLQVLSAAPAQVSDKPSAEQPRNEPVAQQEIRQFRKEGCSDWYDGIPDQSDGGGPYQTRVLFTSPQVQQPMSDEQAFQDDGIMDWNGKYGNWTLPTLMIFIRAVERFHKIGLPTIGG